MTYVWWLLKLTRPLNSFNFFPSDNVSKGYFTDFLYSKGYELNIFFAATIIPADWSSRCNLFICGCLPSTCNFWKLWFAVISLGYKHRSRIRNQLLKCDVLSMFSLNYMLHNVQLKQIKEICLNLFISSLRSTKISIW